MCVQPYRAIVLVSYCLIDQEWCFGGAFYGYVCEVHSFVEVLLGHSYGCVWLYVCECLAFYGHVWSYGYMCNLWLYMAVCVFFRGSNFQDTHMAVYGYMCVNVLAFYGPVWSYVYSMVYGPKTSHSR